ncbi:MAG: hypothetical protein ACI4UM_09570 [Succinivibrio sp.]
MFFSFRKIKDRGFHVTATLKPEIKIDDIRQAVSLEVRRSLEDLVSSRLVKDLCVKKVVEQLKEKAESEQQCLRELKKKSLANRSEFVQKRVVYTDFEQKVREENRASLELASVSSGLDENDLNDFFEPLVTAVIAKGGHLYRNSDSPLPLITEALKLCAIMFELSRTCTYLNEDYTSRAVSLAIMLTAFSHDLGSLCEDHTFCSSPNRTYDPFSIFTDDLIELSHNWIPLTFYSRSKRSEMALELSLCYGMMLINQCALRIIDAIIKEGGKKLVHEIIRPQFGGRLINLLDRAKDLLANGKTVAQCEFIESVRPEFVGVPHTPEDWYDDPKLKDLPYFYPDTVMSRVNLSKSIVFYVNHSAKALDKFLFSYREYRSKQEKEALESQSFINGQKLLQAAAQIDFNRRDLQSHCAHDPEDDAKTGCLSDSSDRKVKYEKGSLESLMLSDELIY